MNKNHNLLSPEYKHNYKIKIAYDGTHYNGWQIQPHSISIQEVIERGLNKFLKETTPIHIIGAGRTDTGVHAKGQVAHFKTQKAVDCFKFLSSANGILPHDIRINSIEEVPATFHSQYSAKSKIYHYHVHLGYVDDPFSRLYHYHFRAHLDIELMKKGALLFLGEHDFTSFSNSAHMGSASKDPIRNLYRLDIIEIDQGIRLEFEGDGFLYKMVRNIVGVLLEIGNGKRNYEDIKRIFEARDRRLAGVAVPPQGLFLMKVNY